MTEPDYFESIRNRPYDQAAARDVEAWEKAKQEPPPAWGIPPEAAMGLARNLSRMAKDVATQVPLGIGDAVDSVTRKVGSVVNEAATATMMFPGGEQIERKGPVPSLDDPRVVPEGPDPETLAGGLARGISTFMTVYAPMAAALGPTTLLGGVAQGAIADIMAFENREGTLSDVIRGFGIDNQMTQFLSGQLSETEWEASLKAATEGAALGLAYPALRGLSKFLRNNPEYAQQFIQRLGEWKTPGGPGTQGGSVGGRYPAGEEISARFADPSLRQGAAVDVNPYSPDDVESFFGREPDGIGDEVLEVYKEVTDEVIARDFVDAVLRAEDNPDALAALEDVVERSLGQKDSRLQRDFYLGVARAAAEDPRTATLVKQYAGGGASVDDIEQMSYTIIHEAADKVYGQLKEQTAARPVRLPGKQEGAVNLSGGPLQPPAAAVQTDAERLFESRRNLMRGLEAGEADASGFFREAPTDEVGQRLQSVIDEGLDAEGEFFSRTALVKALQASAKANPIMVDGKPMSQSAIADWVKQKVKAGDILLPAGPGPAEVVESLKAKHAVVQPQRSTLMTTLYGDRPPLGGQPRPIGATDTNVLTSATGAVVDFSAAADPKAVRAARATARQVLTENYGVRKLLSKNKKLLKTEQKGKGEKKGEGEPLFVEENGVRRGVETIGMSLSPAYREGDFDLCPNHFVCKDSCLGFTAGGNWAYGGGADLDALKGPRLAHFNMTQAFLRDPEAFITALDSQIENALKGATKRGNKLGVRLNTLSDIHPKVFEKLIKKYPDVMFYDYTKLGSKPIAPNHHLTYSSTGVSNPDFGVVNKFQNWTRMRAVLDNSKNVAMAFTVGEGEKLPAFLLDKETGKRYRVVDGDLHDYRPLDAVPEGEAGVIVGLRNKDMGKKGLTREQVLTDPDSKGFFVHFDPSKGDTVEIAVQGRPNAEVRRGGTDLAAKASVPAAVFFAQFPHAEDYTDLGMDEED